MVLKGVFLNKEKIISATVNNCRLRSTGYPGLIVSVLFFNVFLEFLLKITCEI